MKALLHTHSGLRYLVLLAGLVLIVHCVTGLLRKEPPGRALRVIGAAYVGLLDLQILLGLVIVLMGVWYPMLAGHLAMMFLAAVTAHVLLAVNRRRPQPGFLLPLLGAVVSLLLIAGGILAIGRGIFSMSVGAVQ